MTDPFNPDGPSDPEYEPGEADPGPIDPGGPEIPGDAPLEMPQSGAGL